MFFDLGPRKKDLICAVLPPAPVTNWRPPTTFPNLDNASLISFDLERKEYDPDKGPGWSRGKAHTIGVSIGARDRAGNRGAWYFPIRHEVDPELNLPREQVLSFIKSVLETTVPKVGANLYYDVGSLTDDDIYVKGELHDVQHAQALIDSDSYVNLNYLGQHYCGAGKETNSLYKWLKQAYPGKVDPRLNLWRASPALVGPYGEQDALLPIEIIEKQWPLLDKEQLHLVYRVECDLINLLVKMRQRGIRVDIEAAEQLYNDLAQDIAAKYSEIYKLTGAAIDSVSSGKQVAKIFDTFDLPYQKTNDGNPSFRKEWLKGQDHPIARLINETRELEKIRSTFIKSYILDGHINGIIHCCFNQLRTDEGGTVTGRFSSSYPNLQNIPIRTELGKRIRRLFVALVSGHKVRKGDYSQIEYRYLAHYAVGQGSDDLRSKYVNDPKTDYHDNTFRDLAPLMGWDVNDKKAAKELRRPVKNINFGLVYGMGRKKLIKSLMLYFGASTAETEANLLYDNYHKANAFVAPTMEAASNEVVMHGYASTVLGRRTRFVLWEPAVYGEYGPPLPYEAALRQYGSRIKRSGLHKAINYKLQGSAADQIKKGMRDCFVAGVFDATGYPMLQVHDELVFDHLDTPAFEEAFQEAKHILETCIPVRVPIVFEYKDGATWADAE